MVRTAAVGARVTAAPADQVLVALAALARAARDDRVPGQVVVVLARVVPDAVGPDLDGAAQAAAVVAAALA